MANHSNRNWHRRWTLSTDERTATHESGLIARYRDDRVSIDEQSRDAVYAVLAADPDKRPHAAGELTKLLLQAEKVFLEKLPAWRARGVRKRTI